MNEYGRAMLQAAWIRAKRGDDQVRRVCLDGAGACSLRAAISEANALAGADTITIGGVVYTTTLAGTNEDLNANGDYDIRSDITINGVSAATSILQANAAPNTATEKVLHITTGAGAVNINNVTIRNGNSTVNTLGGGVRIDNATNVVNFNNCVISGNRVIIAGNAFAGGLGITAGTVTAGVAYLISAVAPDIP